MSFSNSPPAIAVIGAGFSGSLVATHLLKTANRPLVIKLVERRPEAGKGVAYSTTTSGHLLNVSAGKMSAFPDEPDHLLRWLNYNRSALTGFLPKDFDASTFIPRQVFGLYIQSILEEAEASALSTVRLERVEDEAVAIAPQGQGAVVSLASGQSFVADRLVLALGNAPAGVETDSDRPYLRHAWAANALDDLAPNAPVLLVGTGLTMVDMVVSLHSRRHRGPIYALSRRGLAPLPHQSTLPYPAFLTPDIAPTTLRGLTQRLRREVETAKAYGYDWRSVIDSLRPITQELWQRLPRLEQRRFLRHLSPYWDVHRHRIAPTIGEMIKTLQQSGQLTIAAGRILGYQAISDGVAVSFRRRGSQLDETLQVSRVVNCTGVQADYRRSPQPLIASLRQQQLIRPCDLGLGIDTAADGAVLDAQGRRSTLLYTLGTPRKGQLWESIAVPELREQAQRLASTVLQSLPVRVRPLPTRVYATPQRVAFAQDCGEPAPVLPQSTLVFRQLFDPESSTYTYLIADSQTQEAALVDAVLERSDRDLQILQDLGLTLRYCLETHIHADHITGAGKLRQQTGCRVLVPQNAAHSADHNLADGEILTLGAVRLEAIATPGHTSSHMAYLINNTHLLTGDALLIRGCGRTDLQSGDAGALYDTVTQRLFTLPDTTLVYPAHDYQGRTVSTIGEEKRLNPRFTDGQGLTAGYRTRDQFITLMTHLGLSYPKKINQAVPANEHCGDFIPPSDLDVNSNSQAERDQTEQNLTTNAEIFEGYFAMYI
ncbi:FAD/NAD(P)-binding protein [Nodosilinea sp. FACHB-13]|uniref:FAD/NAD(P)-binding protein n=1 Tax=Cyanophyceae TaxID=3028117 RepID=UPI0016890F34|nr:FAD/NAD(P)-binding protein [Nodosilinea sp. FACHB-13]MBD2108252.1 FAD/NAD(P)-binding protein [Nodosilinea sp. FACHB-13]